jgi:hypothetical protein
MEIIKYDNKPYKGKFQEVWGVRSETNKERIYNVRLTVEGDWQCDCPRGVWTENQAECKHIRYLKNFVQGGFEGVRKARTITETRKASSRKSRFSVVEV